MHCRKLLNTLLNTTPGDEGVLERNRELENENAKLHSLVRKCQARSNNHEVTIENLTTSFDTYCSERHENALQLKELLQYLGTLQQENDDLKNTGRGLQSFASQHATL